MTSQLNSSQQGAPPAAPPGADLTAQAIATHLQRGRYLRSEAFNRGIRGAIGVLDKAYRALRDGLRRHNAHRTTIAELSRINNHMLADIGIQREQIPMIVEGMLDRRASTTEMSPQTADAVAVSTAPGVAYGCGAANDEHCPPLAA
jgi:uncharacterized protein YjiS (DUF1127 family)